MFLNETGIIGQVLNGFTQDVTGSFWLTLFLLTVFIILIGLVFKTPIEILLILLIPFNAVMIFSEYGSSYLVLGGVILLLIGYFVSRVIISILRGN